MTSRFTALAANVADAYRVELISPRTDDVIRDKDGNPAYIEVLSVDSEAGRAFDADARKRAFRAARKSRTGMPDDIDQLEENQHKLARLTKAWHLVDPNTLAPIDVPCSVDSALELYCEPGMNWLFSQAWVGASNAGNFMKRGSTNS